MAYFTGGALAKSKTIDLHVHSRYSDGRLTPAELAARAARNNVVALAVTDHDTMAGTEEKLAACRAAGLVGVPGVELSCRHEGREAHILSLFADAASPWRGRLDELALARRNRMWVMLERLERLGVKVDIAELPVERDGVYGRPHLARALVDKGVVRSVNEAFARYLYDDGPVYVPKTSLPVEEGIDLAKRLGGAAVLAHPGASNWVADIGDFAAMGVDGVEAYHPKHGGETVAKVLRSCRELGLLASGGSDFHSPGDSPDIGSARVPADLLEPLRERAAGNHCM